MEIVYATAHKERECGRVVGVERRVVLGTEGQVQEATGADASGAAAVALPAAGDGGGADGRIVVVAAPLTHPIYRPEFVAPKPKRRRRKKKK